MNDIYKTPESSLDKDEKLDIYDFELYSVGAVTLATFFGTILAGGLIMAINYRRLGKEVAARNTLIFSALATIGLFLIALMIPEDINIPNVVFTLLQLVAMNQIARILQGADIDNHMSNYAPMASNWKAFGISLLVLIGVMALFIPTVMLFMA